MSQEHCQDYLLSSLKYESLPSVDFTEYRFTDTPVYQPVIRFSISFAKVMMIPPATVRKPLALCEGSWLLRLSPTCTIPNPRRISPIALISPNMKSERLLTTVSGSPPAANAVTDRVQIIVSTMTAAQYARNPFLVFP